jgi:hypothetical protein
LEPGGHDAILRVWSGGSSSYVLTDECRCPRQLRTAVVSGHAWPRGLMLVLAGASPRFRRMTPDTAQQRGALAYRQCQRDGNDSCSKHVVLATDKGKSCASLNDPSARNPRVFRELIASRTRQRAEFR